MKIKAKMLIGILTLIILIIITGIISSTQNQKTQNAYDDLIKNDEEVRFLVKNIQYRITGISNDERAFLLVGDDNFTKEIQNKASEITANIETIRQKNLDTKEQEAITALEQQLQTYLQMNEKVLSIYKESPKQALQMHMNEERDLRKQHLDPALNDVVQTIEETTTAHIESINKADQQTLLFIRITLIISVIIGFIILLILQKSLKPINQLQDALHKVTDGDLTNNIDIKTKDEIAELAHSVNQMIDTLRQTISTIYDSSHQVSASAEELSASSEQSTKTTEHLSRLTQDLANSTEAQLEKFNTMSTIVNDLADGILQVHKNGEEMDGLSHTANNAALEGHKGMTTIVSEMNTIHTSVDETYKIIQGLEEKSAAIENIVALISNLAEQTNLLALNAAIEAARAGEHGKGFAVVADEVRKLAEESKTSANNVREVLAEIQRETEVAANSMNNGLNKVAAGIQSTNQVSTTFQTIQAAITKLSQKVAEVSTHLKDMSQQSDHVVAYVSDVQSIAEQNTTATHESLATTQQQLATAEETLSSAETLASLADKQKSMITQFKI